MDLDEIFRANSRWAWNKSIKFMTITHGKGDLGANFKHPIYAHIVLSYIKFATLITKMQKFLLELITCLRTQDLCVLCVWDALVWLSCLIVLLLASCLTLLLICVHAELSCLEATRTVFTSCCFWLHVFMYFVYDSYTNNNSQPAVRWWGSESSDRSKARAGLVLATWMSLWFNGWCSRPP